MKKITTLFTCFILLTTVLFAQEEEEGGSIPSINLKTLEGEVVKSDEIIGEGITMFTFWATWCKPCKVELDTYADYYDEWTENYGVKIVAISIDTRRAIPNAINEVTTKGWPYDVYLDSNRNFHTAVGGVNVPYTVIVKDGKVVYKHDGFKLGDEVEMGERLADLAKE